MSETRTIEHIRECAEKARDALAEAQGIYAKEHQSPRWEAAKNKWLALKADYHAAIEPEAMLSLLDGIAPTTPPDGDVRMLLVWEAWAKNEGNGAAGLFRRCADRLRSLSVPETRGARSETPATEARHVCGLTGFGIGPDGLNDRCPACEEFWRPSSGSTGT